MKKIMVTINGKKNGPFDVFGDDDAELIALWDDAFVCLKKLKYLGAIVKEVKEPLVWEGEVYAYNNGAITNAAVILIKDSEKLIGKRFKCKLEEIVE